MSRILVTGATGLLGRHVVRELLTHGHAVNGLDRRPAEEAIDWFVGDVTDPALVADATAGVDAVLHIAAVPNIWSGDGPDHHAGQSARHLHRVRGGGGRGRAKGRLLLQRFGRRLHRRRRPHVAAALGAARPGAPSVGHRPLCGLQVLGEDMARAFALRGLSVVALRTVFVAYPEMAGEIVARAKAPQAYRGPMVGGPSAAGGGPLHHHIDPRDLARAFRLAVELDLAPGDFERFYLSARVTLSPEPTLERLRRLHGDVVEIRDPAVYAGNPFAPLYDLTHAERRLGFIAVHDQRHLLAGPPRIPQRRMR